MKTLNNYINEARKPKQYIPDESLEVGPNLAQDINLIKQFEKYFIKSSMFALWTIDDKRIDKTYEEGGPKLKIEINPETKEIYLLNISYLITNITSGLQKYYSDYKIVMPEGSVVVIRDSFSSFRHISNVKYPFLNVFSENNKFECVQLVYINLANSDIADDFLDSIDTNNLQFISCKGHRSMKIDYRKFKNKDTKLVDNEKKTFDAKVKEENKKVELDIARQEEIEKSKNNPETIYIPSDITYYVSDWYTNSNSKETFMAKFAGRRSDYALHKFYDNELKDKLKKGYYVEIEGKVGALDYFDWSGNYGGQMPEVILLKFIK